MNINDKQKSKIAQSAAVIVFALAALAAAVHFTDSREAETQSELVEIETEIYIEAEAETESEVETEIEAEAEGSTEADIEIEAEQEAGSRVIAVSHRDMIVRRSITYRMDDYGWENFLYVRYKRAYDENGNILEEYEYDSDGNIVGWIEYCYDSEGNELTETGYDSDGIRSKIEFNYDTEGNKLSKIEMHYNSDGSISSESEEYYDGEGNIVKKLSNRYGNYQVIMEYEYAHDSEGNLIRENSIQESTYISDDGTSTTSKFYIHTIEYEYNEDGYVEKEISWYEGDVSLESITEYYYEIEYDDAGNLVYIRCEDERGFGWTEWYSYDSVGNLLSDERQGAAYSYWFGTYDDAGNLLTARAGVPTLDANEFTVYEYYEVGWEQTYCDFIEEAKFEAQSEHDIAYSLIYLDGDDIPELVVDEIGNCDYVYAYYHGDVVEFAKIEYGANGMAGAEYSEGCGWVRKDESDRGWQIFDEAYYMLENLYELKYMGSVTIYSYDDMNGNGILDDGDVGEYCEGTHGSTVREGILPSDELEWEYLHADRKSLEQILEMLQES